MKTKFDTQATESINTYVESPFEMASFCLFILINVDTGLIGKGV